MSATATDTRGKYVSAVEVANGIITITYGGDVNAAIDDETLALTPYVTPDNSVAWRCGGADAPGRSHDADGRRHAHRRLARLEDAALNKYLPAACRP